MNARKSDESDSQGLALPEPRDHRGVRHRDDKENPGTYRESDGSRVDFPSAIATWATAALPVLGRVARTYHSTITYKELGAEIQHVTGIHTRMLLMNWIGQVLGGASRVSHRRGQPMLSSLCVHSDGTIGAGYGEAVLENYGSPLPDDLDMHAAGERLRCYQYFGADLPPGGGIPALTAQVAARRVWLARQAKAETPAQPCCLTCNLTMINAAFQFLRTPAGRDGQVRRQSEHRRVATAR